MILPLFSGFSSCHSLAVFQRTAMLTASFVIPSNSGELQLVLHICCQMSMNSMVFFCRIYFLSLFNNISVFYANTSSTIYNCRASKNVFYKSYKSHKSYRSYSSLFPVSKAAPNTPALSPRSGRSSGILSSLLNRCRSRACTASFE